MKSYGKARDFVPDTKSSGEQSVDPPPYVEPASKQVDDGVTDSDGNISLALLQKRIQESAVLVLPGDIVYIYLDNGLRVFKYFFH